MKRLLMLLVVLGLAVSVATPAFCDEQEEYSQPYGYGYHMMGPGYGMGSGYMMGYGSRGWGMHGRGWGMHGPGWDWDQGPRGWSSMKPEQQEKWKKMRSAYLMDTLKLRKGLAAKQTEPQTLWAQPNVDRAKVQRLSNEVAELQVELLKKRDKYLLQCRQEFGDQGWQCPGSGW